MKSWAVSDPYSCQLPVKQILLVSIVKFDTYKTTLPVECLRFLRKIVFLEHNEELNELYSSPNIVRVIKSRRMRWAGHVARMGEERGCIGS